LHTNLLPSSLVWPLEDITTAAATGPGMVLITDQADTITITITTHTVPPHISPPTHVVLLRVPAMAEVIIVGIITTAQALRALTMVAADIAIILMGITLISNTLEAHHKVM
jgi:hypothetical protein